MINDQQSRGFGPVIEVLGHVLDEVAQPIEHGRQAGPGLRTTPEASPPAAIVEALMREAFGDGRLSAHARWKNFNRFASGSSAELVGRLDLDVPCVIKIDTNTKLVAEARVLRQLADRDDLSDDFRRCFPRIFAVREEPPVFAYLMENVGTEQGFLGTADLLFGDGRDDDRVLLSDRLANKLMDVLLSAYGQSLNHRFRPSVIVDYVDRISGRLFEAAELADAFVSRTVDVEGHSRTYRPWTEYLRLLRAHSREVEALAPPFVTFVHGDPNPENVLAFIDAASVRLRFIDIKEWRDGDYLFDIAKFLHYMQVTGPVERLKSLRFAEFSVENGRGKLRYDLSVPLWVTSMTDTIMARVEYFARMKSDNLWRSRIRLGMASNLLGLPATRWQLGRSESALVCFAEGLRHLDDFCTENGFL